MLGAMRQKGFRKIAKMALLSAALALADAGAQSVETTCEVALVQLHPNNANTLLLDKSAVYWLGAYQAVPGTRIRITGEFPHSRYMSFNLYDVAARSIDSLPDVEIQPDSESMNPFLPGANRDATERRYTVYIDFGSPPATPAPNTLYAGTSQAGQPNVNGTFWYRVYVPDQGLDDMGGVGLPRAFVEHDPNGPTLPPLDCTSLEEPNSSAVNEAIAQASTPDVVIPGLSAQFPGRKPPAWRRFVNLATSLRDYFMDNPEGDEIGQGRVPQPPQSPGIFDNHDIAYVYAPTSQGYGDLLVLHGRAPTFADTVAGAATMPSGTQVRYFSFCEYEPATQRMIDCLRDDEILTDQDGFFTIVVSAPAHRPATATKPCGVNWLAWGPAKHGLLIYRQMLADASFTEAIQQILLRDTEEATMGDYWPAGTYLPDESAFPSPACSTP